MSSDDSGLGEAMKERMHTHLRRLIEDDEGEQLAQFLDGAGALANEAVQYTDWVRKR